MSPSKEYEKKDDILADIESVVYSNLAEGNIPLNENAGDETDSKLGGGPKSFRCSKYLGGLIEEMKKDLYPRLKHESDVLRTAVTAFTLAWIEVRKAGKLSSVKASIDAEKVMISTLREESARRDVIDRLKLLGGIIDKYRVEGDLKYAVTLLRNWIDIIKDDPDERVRRRYTSLMRNQPVLMSTVNDAIVHGYAEAHQVREFLESKEI